MRLVTILVLLAVTFWALLLTVKQETVTFSSPLLL